MKSPHPKRAPFRAGTTRVSNPVCSPCFRASASVAFQRSAFATGVLHDINAFHRYTMHSDLPSRTPAGQFRAHFMGWAHGFHTRHARPPTRPLRPVNPNNARHLCITAAAGTELAVASSFGTLVPADVLYRSALFPNHRSLRPEGLHPPRSVASSGFPPLRMILDCSLP